MISFNQERSSFSDC